MTGDLRPKVSKKPEALRKLRTARQPKKPEPIKILENITGRKARLPKTRK